MGLRASEPVARAGPTARFTVLTATSKRRAAASGCAQGLTVGHRAYQAFLHGGRLGTHTGGSASPLPAPASRKVL
jgi:hypothetical protein